MPVAACQAPAALESRLARIEAAIDALTISDGTAHILAEDPFHFLCHDLCVGIRQTSAAPPDTAGPVMVRYFSLSRTVGKRECPAVEASTSNGTVERFHRQLKGALIVGSDPSRWSDVLPSGYSVLGTMPFVVLSNPPTMDLSQYLDEKNRFSSSNEVEKKVPHLSMQRRR
ncbi:unnamed protein product [Mesocestoides corti]|uniref:Integrase catalytic domain-containing protein n=1 Tax=Mesocestoides corti TaxID=53468 RepID=A0A0R3URN0_MESCO|nr:unnamed protein product [Mesocestoides corti]